MTTNCWRSFRKSWVNAAAADAVDSARSQLLLISHHPEFLNQWLPEYGIEFVREDAGPVRIKPFEPVDSALTPAELVARGWEP